MKVFGEQELELFIQSFLYLKKSGRLKEKHGI